MNYNISHPTKIVNCEIDLPSSKSISNRLLIIQALCEKNFQINNLSNSNDTTYLKKALEMNSGTIDVGAGGTTFRFLSAYLAGRKGKEFILTGTNRIKERPIKELVEVLRTLGSKITYLEKKHFPPLKIKGRRMIGGKVSIDGGISSQFISSLLLIAPTLQKGIILKIKGEIVSKPYIEMTLKLMQQYGIIYTWTDNIITISPQKYSPKRFHVESDWSAATFWFEIAALSNKCKIILQGLTDTKNLVHMNPDPVLRDPYLEMVAFSVQITWVELAVVKPPPRNGPATYRNNPATQTVNVLKAISMF